MLLLNPINNRQFDQHHLQNAFVALPGDEVLAIRQVILDKWVVALPVLTISIIFGIVCEVLLYLHSTPAKQAYLLRLYIRLLHYKVF